MTAITQRAEANRLQRLWANWLEPVVGWLKELTRGERALLLAVLFLGAVGSYGSHEFFSVARGQVVGWLAALGIELLYLGSSGVAVKLPGQIWLARSLMVLGAVGSSFFNVLVGLRQRLPHLFAPTPIWPTTSQWIVHGGVSLVEGVLIPLAALLVAMLLHSMTSHRLIEAEDDEQRIEARRNAKPFGCPFCAASFETSAKLYGHVGRCEGYKQSELAEVERKEIVRRAVAEASEAILRG